MVQRIYTAPVAEEGLSGDLTFAAPKGSMNPDVLLSDGNCFDRGWEQSREKGRRGAGAARRRQSYFSRDSFQMLYSLH